MNSGKSLVFDVYDSNTDVTSVQGKLKYPLVNPSCEAPDRSVFFFYTEMQKSMNNPHKNFGFDV